MAPQRSSARLSSCGPSNPVVPGRGPGGLLSIPCQSRPVHPPDRRQIFTSAPDSAPFPKFVIHLSTLLHELRKQRGTSNSMILVPLFDLKFLTAFAASYVGTSNRRD